MEILDEFGLLAGCKCGGLHSLISTHSFTLQAVQVDVGENEKVGLSLGFVFNCWF